MADEYADVASEGYGACKFCHTEACDEVLVALGTDSSRAFVEVCAMHKMDVKEAVGRE